MASCVKCLKNTPLKDIVTIKWSENRKLYETLFKNALAETLRVCKTCFGELMNKNAEFLDKKDIGEIPASWLQDENDAVEVYDLDCEQQITTYNIVALPSIINQPEYEKQQTFERKTTNPTKRTIAKKQQQHKRKSKKLNAKQLSQPNQDIPIFVIEDSNSNNCETILGYDYGDITVDNNTESLLERLQPQENEVSKENIPTINIDDDDESDCVHFIEEVQSFDQTANINEDSIDFKEDLGVFEIQAQDGMSNFDDDGTNLSNTIEIDDDSSNIHEQMPIADEFEKNCEDMEDTIPEIPHHSISCNEIRFNTETCDTDDDGFSFICSACGEISDKMTKIEQHITIADYKSTCKKAKIEKQKLEHALCCEYCGLFYRHPTDLQAHRATGIHFDLLYSCSECTQCFKEFTTLFNHTRNHAAQCLKFNPMFMCNVGECVEVCLDWPLLGKHKERCHVAQICPVCREQFHDGRFFITHVKDCKEVNAKCDFCVKRFDKSSKRTFHANDCPKKPSTIFYCKNCDARFKSRMRLDDHNMRRHQPIDCADCGKIFKNKRSLSAHTSFCRKKTAKEKSNPITLY